MADLLQLAEKNLARDRWMHWRVRRYGYACLTSREYDAMYCEMQILSPMVAVPVDAAIVSHWRELAVQREVAKLMRVTQGRVSQLLKQAEDVMLYFDAHGIGARWMVDGEFWTLDAPVQPGYMSIHLSYLIKANSRAMMRLENRTS